jgi:hypothetical protein
MGIEVIEPPDMKFDSDAEHAKFVFSVLVKKALEAPRSKQEENNKIYCLYRLTAQLFSSVYVTMAQSTNEDLAIFCEKLNLLAFSVSGKSKEMSVNALRDIANHVERMQW